MTAFYQRTGLTVNLTAAQVDSMFAALSVKSLSLAVATVANQDYVVSVKMPHGGTITETATIATSGTCTATWKVNSTALATTNAVSSTLQAQAQSQTFVAGDTIKVTISANATCLGLAASIKYTRTIE